MSVSEDDIRRAVRQLGLSGRAVCVHSSLRSFGHVTGGADAVVDAFLTEGSTLVVPSFTWALGVPPPPHLRYKRNGWNYERDVAPTTGIGRIFTSATLEIEKEMGAVAAAVVARPERARGNHPLCSFSAIGSLAHQMVQKQRPDDVFAPLQVLGQSGGYIVLMGLDLRRLTLIHLAEKLSGRTLLRRWANDATGRTIAMEVGGHSRGFEALHPHLPCLRTYQVGPSQWTFAPAQSVLDQAVEALRRDPAITHCEYPDCRQCNDIAAGGPILDSCTECGPYPTGGHNSHRRKQR